MSNPIEKQPPLEVIGMIGPEPGQVVDNKKIHALVTGYFADRSPVAGFLISEGPAALQVLASVFEQYPRLFPQIIEGITTIAEESDRLVILGERSDTPKIILLAGKRDIPVQQLYLEQISLDRYQEKVGMLNALLHETPDPITASRILLQYYPELRLLASKVVGTPEKDSPGIKTISQKLADEGEPGFDGKKYPEFDRTALSDLCLLWVLKKDYGSFTASQKGPVRLTEDTFYKRIIPFVEQVIGDIDNVENVNALIELINLVDVGMFQLSVHDTTKAVQVITELKTEHIQAADHDELLPVALEKLPQSYPNFYKLPEKYRNLFLTSLRGNLNILQLNQGESIAEEINSIKDLPKEARKLYYLLAFFDLAGAQGHNVPEGKGSMLIEPVAKGFFDTMDAVEYGIERNMDADGIYSEVLRRKYESAGLDMNKPDDKAVAKLCSMARLTKPDDVKAVQNIYAQFTDKTLLTQELTTTGTKDIPGIKLYFSPGTIANLVGKLRSSGSTNPTIEAMNIILPLFTGIYREARKYLRDHNRQNESGVFTVKLGSLGDAKSATDLAAEDPAKLITEAFYLRPNGKDVDLVYPSPSSVSEISQA